MTGRDWIADPPQESPRAARRRERAQQRAQHRQDVRQRGRNVSAQVTAPGALVGIVFLLVVMGLLAYLPELLHRTPGATPPTSVSSTSAVATASSSTPPAPPSPVASSVAPSTSSTSAAPGLAGDELATSWLRSYLTRTSPTDTSWTTAVAGISDPALVAQLCGADPSQLGLPSWSPWHVTDVRSITLADQGVSTPTRAVSSWVVTLSDGAGHTETRGFTTIAYRGTGQWLVAQVAHLYSSGG